MAIGALLGQQALHHPLGSDAGVVFAGQPKHGIAAHPPPAAQSVLDGSGKGVAQVQLAGNIGRRHNDDIGRPGRVNRRGKVALVQPILIKGLFHGGGIIGPGDVGGSRGRRGRSSHKSFLKSEDRD